jgi:hypothetical protein
MLGLGASIVSSSYDSLDQLGTYTSNFAAGTDSWGDFGISVGTQTKTANQSVGGRSGVLKVSYDANETVLFGISKATPWGETFDVGDIVVVSMDVYFVDNDPQDDDGDGNENATFYFQAGSTFNTSRRKGQLVVPETWTTTSGTLNITGGSASANMQISPSNGQSDAPGTGDVWYVDNVVVKHYRPR